MMPPSRPALAGAGGQHGSVSGDDVVGDPGEDYAWLIETSDEGQTWWQESHPVHGLRGSGGIERAANAEALARAVLDRRFALLRGDYDYDWEGLYFRVTVWDFRACVDYAGWDRAPYLPEKARISPTGYGRYLQVHKAEPHAIEVRVPRQVRARVWATPRARGGRGVEDTVPISIG